MKRLVVALISLIVAVAAPSAGAATAQQTIAKLNAQRGANGIPAGISENTTWSAYCLLHINYMVLNHTLTHIEETGKPGYDPNGAWAGRNSVLSHGGNWDSGNPYESAPIHLDQLLAPRLVSVGTADSEGYSCTTTFPGWTRSGPSKLTVYTYPGNGAPIYASEIASESPFTPGSLVGIPLGTVTGPYLFVLADAPGASPLANPAKLSGATLTGPHGSVPVKTVDGYTPVPGGGTLGPYLSPGGFIIPTAPLETNSVYRAHVVVDFAGKRTTHDWFFGTGSGRVKDPDSKLSLKNGVLSFSSRSPASIVVRFTRVNGAHAPSITIKPGGHLRPHLQPGRWRACGHQNAAAGYVFYDRCLALTVTGAPSLSLSKPRIRHGQLVLTLRYSAILRGRRATLKTTQLTIISCSRTTCRTRPGRSSQRAMKLKGNTLTLPAPARGHGLRIVLSTAAFTVGDAPWTSARAKLLFLRR